MVKTKARTHRNVCVRARKKLRARAWSVTRSASWAAGCASRADRRRLGRRRRDYRACGRGRYDDRRRRHRRRRGLRRRALTNGGRRRGGRVPLRRPRMSLAPTTARAAGVDYGTAGSESNERRRSGQHPILHLRPLNVNRRFCWRRVRAPDHAPRLLAIDAPAKLRGAPGSGDASAAYIVLQRSESIAARHVRAFDVYPF